MSSKATCGRVGIVAGRRALSVIAWVAMAACSEGGSAAEDPAGSAAASDVAASAPAATAGTPAQPATVADLFPAGEERQMVLSNCATCHAVACAAIGQRSAARWETLASSHREHVPNLPDADRQRIFAYLSANFNESRPEPIVPPEFMDRGCTPF